MHERNLRGVGMETAEAFDRQAAIEEFEPLVRHIVFQVAVHFPRHVDREELSRAGALGLVEAAQRYDLDRGVPFQRFAAQRIRGAILDAVRAADWAPRSLRTMARSFEQTSQRLANEFGRPATLDEIAESMATTTEQLLKLQGKINRSVVLALDHMSSDEDESMTLGETLMDSANLEPSEELERRELHAYLRDAIALLPERHRLVVIGYFLEGRTSHDLARFLGVTASRVSQMRSEALEMLRQGISAQYESQEDLDEQDPTGVAVERRARFAGALGEFSNWRDRITV